MFLFTLQKFSNISKYMFFNIKKAEKVWKMEYIIIFYKNNKFR